MQILPNKSYDIMSAVANMSYQIKSWQEVKDRAAAEILKEARTEIQKAKVRLASKTKADRHSAIGHVRMWAINYHGPLLAALPLIYPTDEKNADSVLTLTEAQKSSLAQAVTLAQEIRGLEDTIDKTLKARAAAHRARIAGARFPANAAPLSRGKAGILKALAAEFGEPLRTGVYANWSSRKEARWIGHAWDVGVFNYVGVWVAAKTPSGKFRVYRTTLRQRKSTGGSWGPVRYWSVGQSFEILQENINK